MTRGPCLRYGVVCAFLLTIASSQGTESNEDLACLLQIGVHSKLVSSHIDTLDDGAQFDSETAEGVAPRKELPPVICRNRTEAEFYALGMVPLPANGCPSMSAEEYKAPLVDMKLGANQDRSCLVFKQCAAAHESNNLAIYSRTFASSYAAVQGESQNPRDYDDGVLKMPAHSWLGDTEYCLQSGFFDIPNPHGLLQNGELLQHQVRQICSEIPEDLKKSISMKHLSELWDRMNNGASAQALLPAGQQRPFINASEAKLHNAAYCATGAMDCMLYWCLDFFCKLPDGRIGSGCQCQKDFSYGMP